LKSSGAEVRITSMKRFLPLLLLAGSTLPASAHPSLFHGTGPVGSVSEGFLHPFSGLDHLLVMVAVGLWAVQIGGRALWLLPFAFVASMTAGGMLGLASGIMAPVAEHGILASLFLFGTALGMAWRPRLAVAVLITGLAGLCHGHAHGSEMPAGASPLVFLAGMIAATAVLLAVGIGGGLGLRHTGSQGFLRTAGASVLLFAAYAALHPAA
jgi:urease accessory protein